MRENVAAAEGELRGGTEVESGADEVLLGFGKDAVAAVVAMGNEGEAGVTDGVLAVEREPGIEIGIDEELRGSTGAPECAE